MAGFLRELVVARTVHVEKRKAAKLTHKGTPFRRIIRRYVKDGREYQLHATKGWRIYRA